MLHKKKLSTEYVSTGCDTEVQVCLFDVDAGIYGIKAVCRVVGYDQCHRMSLAVKHVGCIDYSAFDSAREVQARTYECYMGQRFSHYLFFPSSEAYNPDML